MTLPRSTAQQMQSPSASNDQQEAEQAQLDRQTQVEVKALLDKHFPLDGGSHQDVASYSIYYCNLMVCFKDGRLSGLQNPAQFVAMGGHKDTPEALILRNNAGSGQQYRWVAPEIVQMIQ